MSCRRYHTSIVRTWSCWALLSLTCCFLLQTTDAKTAASSPDPSSVSSPLFSARRKLRFLLRQQVRFNRKSPTSQPSGSNKPSGSFLTLCTPTPEHLSRWFWNDDASLSTFNHKSAGMTNPCLHVTVAQDPMMKTAFVSSVASIETTPSNKQQESSGESSGESSSSMPWWPETASRAEYAASSSSSTARVKNNNWRVLSFQRHVGRGLDCYQRARDAALAWEFHSPKGDKGVFCVKPVLSHAATTDPQQQRRHAYNTVAQDVLNPMQSNQVQQIWSGPGRRLATFTATKLLPFLPRLYCINPVHVVYDLVDQRGPGTTYSSTAYATGARHWIRGEERVTVALRDNGVVDVQILSFSKPAKSLAGRLVWPMIGKMQQRFFQEQMNALERLAAQSSEGQQQSSTSSTALDLLPSGSIVHVKR